METGHTYETSTLPGACRSDTMPILFRDLLEELKRFNSLGRGRGKGGDGADRILPPILRTLQLLLASPTAAAGSARAGKLRLWDGGGDGRRAAAEDEGPGSETASEVDDLRKVTLSSAIISMTSGFKKYLSL